MLTAYRQATADNLLILYAHADAQRLEVCMIDVSLHSVRPADYGNIAEQQQQRRCLLKRKQKIMQIREHRYLADKLPEFRARKKLSFNPSIESCQTSTLPLI